MRIQRREQRDCFEFPTAVGHLYMKHKLYYIALHRTSPLELVILGKLWTADVSYAIILGSNKSTYVIQATAVQLSQQTLLHGARSGDEV